MSALRGSGLYARQNPLRGSGLPMKRRMDGKRACGHTLTAQVYYRGLS